MAAPTPQHDPARDDPKPEESRRDWENVQSNKTDKTERLKIHGGWLYRVIAGTGTGNITVALTFVPESRA